MFVQLNTLLYLLANGIPVDMGGRCGVSGGLLFFGGGGGERGTKINLTEWKRLVAARHKAGCGDLA